MGFLDKLIKNVSSDVLDSAIRQAEHKASVSISNKMTSVASNVADKAKTKIDNKKDELRDRIIEESKKQKMPDIVPNGESGTSETLKFAAHETVKYHYINTDKGIDTYVPMIVVGGMSYKVPASGSYVGRDSVADDLAYAVINAFQAALDKIVDKHIAPEDLYSKQAMNLSTLTKEGIEDICTQYEIPERTILLSVIHPGKDYVIPNESGSNSASTASWICPYCGSHASGATCPSCGANQNS